MRTYLQLGSTCFYILQMRVSNFSGISALQVLQVDEDVQLQYLKATQTAGVYVWP